MLTIKCTACKKKLWRYNKLGHGEVLRCYKERILKIYNVTQDGDYVKCSCGKTVGIDKGSYIKMIRKAFIYTGTKKHK